MEVFVDDETKLTLHGLQQYYCKLKDSEKNRKLFDLLDVLEFNQVRPSLLLDLVLHLCSSHPRPPLSSSLFQLSSFLPPSSFLHLSSLLQPM